MKTGVGGGPQEVREDWPSELVRYRELRQVFDELNQGELFRWMMPAADKNDELLSAVKEEMRTIESRILRQLSSIRGPVLV